MSAALQQEVTDLRALITQLQGQIANLQAPAPPPPPVPQAPTVKVAKPEDFDGRSEHLEQFIHQCTLFLSLEPYTDRAKVTLVLSYMKKGSALTWAEQKLDEYSRAAWVITWAGFLIHLRAAFGDIDRTKTARLKIYEVKQGSRSVDEYNVDFMSLQAHTGFNDEASLEIYKKGLNATILKMIYAEPAEPADFAAWRTRASHYDRANKELAASLRARQQTSSSSHSSSKYKHSGSTVIASTSTSTTTSAAPIKIKQEAVDPVIAAQRKKDGLCIICGDAGHWANVCPKRTTATPARGGWRGRGRGKGRGGSSSSRKINNVETVNTPASVVELGGSK